LRVKLIWGVSVKVGVRVRVKVVSEDYG
jgi:hypothetical protein